MRHKGMEGVGTKRRKKRWHKSQRYTSEERPGRARPLQKEKARRGNWRALRPDSGQARTAIIPREWRGVGKTTLARILAERLHARRIYDCEDNPFLAEFYAEKPGAALRAQMYFLMERQKRIREGLAGDAPGPVISDFLMEKGRIFANLNLDDKELKLYEGYYEMLTAEIPEPHLVIYLQAKPEVRRARIAKKKAAEEKQIAQEYVEEVARVYEHFFFRYDAADLLVVHT